MSPYNQSYRNTYEMKAFDGLPRDIRDALNDLPAGFPATLCVAAINHGTPASDVLAGLQAVRSDKDADRLFKLMVGRVNRAPVSWV